MKNTYLNGQALLMRRALLLLLLIGLGKLGAQAQSQIPQIPLVNSIPGGQIQSLAIEPQNKLLFIGTEFGSVIVYDLQTNLIVQRINAGNAAISQISVHQNGTLALVQRTANRKYKLQVFDWKSGAKRYSKDLIDQALHLAVSPQGNYVVLTLPSRSSLLCLDSQRGFAVNWLGSTAGIIDFFLVSLREDKIVCYFAAQGSIVYFDLVSGNELRRISTKASLRQFQLLPDGSRSKAFAIDGNTIVTIDLLDGKTTAVANSKRDRQVVLADQTNKSIYSISLLRRALSLTEFVINDKLQLVAGMESSVLGTVLPTGTTAFMGALYLADDDQNVSVYQGKTKKTPLFFQTLEPIQALFFSKGSMIVGANKQFYKFDSTAFTKQIGTEHSILNSGRIWKTLDLTGPFSTFKGKDDEIYLFEKIRRGRLLKIQESSGRFEVLHTSGSEIVRAGINGTFLYLLESTGAIKIWNSTGPRNAKSFNFSGTQDLLPFENGDLYLGKPSTASLSEALIVVKTNTGESIGYKTDDSIIYALGSFPSSQGGNNLLSLSQKRQGGMAVRMWHSLDYKNVELIEIAEEDSQASMVVDQNWIYLLVAGRIIRSDASTQVQFQASNQSVHRLSIDNDFVVGYHHDGSVSLWNKSNGNFLLSLCLLSDGNLLVLNDGGFISTAQNPAMASEKINSIVQELRVRTGVSFGLQNSGFTQVRMRDKAIF